MALFLKFLTDRREGTCQAHGFVYPAFPKNGKPGPWKRDTRTLPTKGGASRAPKVCCRGWHATQPNTPSILHWGNRYSSERCFLVELGGRSSTSHDKVCADRMRFIRELHGWGGLKRHMALTPGVREPWRRAQVRKWLASHGVKLAELGGPIVKTAGARYCK